MSKGGSTAAMVCTFAIISAIPIAMIILGAQHMDQCPMEPWIPKFMVIGGAATLVMFLLMGIMAVCGKMESKMALVCSGVLVALVTLFLFGWNIAGSYWVFKEWKNWDDVKNDPTKGCHNPTYLFVFSILIIGWVSCPCQMLASKKSRESSEA